MIPKIIFNREKKDWIKRPLLSNIEKILDYRGRTPKKLGLSWSDTGFLALSALNVKNGYIDFNADANYGDQELYERWMGDNHLHKGQVVFTTEAPMGNVAQIPNDDLYILSQRTIAFEVKHDLIREDFLATLLRSPKIFNELTSLSSGGTAKGISQKSLSNLKVCLPTSLEEQSAIGSLFRTLDDLLSSYKDNLANYQSLKATMLSKMFTKAGQTVPEIRLDGFEGEWEIKKFKSISTKRGKSNSKGYDYPAYSVSNQSGLIPQSEQFEGSRLGNLEKTSYKIVEPNEFAYNPARINVGSIAFNDLDETVIVSSLYVIFSLDKSINNNYALLFINSPEFNKEVRRNTEGSVREYLFYENFANIRIPIPPTFEEQCFIGSYFSNLDNLINSHQEKISQLETFKKKLLQDMFI
ncbi:restriction endonuclease subunit S [Streptococcus oralis]|uniref:restriction endonuclease subunit S n=1 Tax=Streptococcus oralis TaxID=1303 RepID=UPI0022849901|nr:restriction endonuclease subunit S [Streptococcus oralis]MCY7110087.1 restriction endonuclease subunit S [Streptococcus oralis]